MHDWLLSNHMHVMNVIMFCRTAPHISVVHLPEEPILQFAVALRIEINRGFTALRDIGSRRDLKKTLSLIQINLF